VQYTGSYFTHLHTYRVHPTGELPMSTNINAVAVHVLRHLASAQQKGRNTRLDELASDIGVRREDVRHVVTSLHEEGHVDARRMRLTMTGFAIAASMRDCRLRDLRERVPCDAHGTAAARIPAPTPSQLRCA